MLINIKKIHDEGVYYAFSACHVKGGQDLKTQFNKRTTINLL
jgi:hypothetical protein